MSETWRELTVTEMSEVVGGGTPSTKRPDNFDGDVPWLTPKDLSGYGERFISRGARNISEAGLQRSSAKLMPQGTVLLTSRAPVGYLAIARNPICTNQGFKSLVPKEGFDSEFLYYLLLANVEYLRSQASGTTFLEISGGVLKRLRFRVPPLPVQKQIARILGSLDDKIELNRRMNETLEAMARALFKCWFVDFEPVRIKQAARERGEDAIAALMKPASEGGLGMDLDLATLFPDRFVETELGEIPYEWSVGRLGDLAVNHREQVDPATIDGASPYIGLEHMPRGSISLSEWGSAAELKSGKFAFKQRHLLFGKLRPYFHKVGVAPVDGVCSTDILVVAPKFEQHFGYVLGHLSSHELISHAVACSDGTKMPRTKWIDLATYEILKPTASLLSAFNEFIDPVIKRIVANNAENRTLSAIRDTLLPKLLSGEIPFSESESVPA